MLKYMKYTGQVGDSMAKEKKTYYTFLLNLFCLDNIPEVEIFNKVLF